MRKYWLYFVLLALALGLLVYSQANVEKEDDWRDSFSRYDKIPYGSYALYQLMQESRGEQLETVDSPLYNVMEDFSTPEDTGYNLIIINSSFSPDKVESRKLLDFVAKGNNLFIAAAFFGPSLTDTLKTPIAYTGIFSSSKDSTFLSFTNPSLGGAYKYEASRFSYYFSLPDTPLITILGKTGHGDPNFIRYQLGKGYVYMHTGPHAFTNYELMERNNWEYAFKALSYLPNQFTLWDEYNKVYSGGVHAREKHYSDVSSILDSEALRYAYYLLLISLVFYILFQGKRKQRIIPVIEPVKNTTVEFVETVGRLYYENRNNKNLAEKKISHFYDFLRQRLYLRFTQPDERLYQQISTKMAIPLEQVETLFVEIDKITQRDVIPDNELIALNNRIDNFYKRFNG